MTARRLCLGEKMLLAQMFGTSLPYDRMLCDTNTPNFGGPDNSITPNGIIYFSSKVYCNDFSKTDRHRQWLFFHESTHAWQWYHGRAVGLSAVWLKLASLGDYKSVYKYDLSSGSKFADFNIEQQASIVADYWSLSQGGGTYDNVNIRPSMSDYDTVMSDFANICSDTDV